MPRNSNNPRYRKKYKGIMIDLTAPTAAELEEKVRRRKNEIDAGEELGSSAGTLVRVWADAWLETYKKGKISAKNYKTYEANIRLHILPMIGAMKLADVHNFDLQRILNAHEHESSTHVEHIKNALTGMFRSAQRNGLIRGNPAEDLRIPKECRDREEDDESGGRSLTLEEQDMFLAHVDETAHGFFFKIIYYCNLRPSEVCALTPAVFDLTPGKETVKVTQAVESGTRAIHPPKTKAGRRTVPIPAAFVPDIKNNLKGKKKNELIFTTETGLTVDAETSRQWWRYARNSIDRASGAKTYRNKITEHVFGGDLTQYDLRHTCCTNYQRAGIAINVAKIFMGHSSIEVTAKDYTHHTEDMTDDARNKLSALEKKKKHSKRYRIARRTL